MHPEKKTEREDLELVDRAFIALLRSGGSYLAASEELRRQGYQVLPGKIKRWREQDYADRYRRLVVMGPAQAEFEIAARVREQMMGATIAASKLIAEINRRVAEGEITELRARELAAMLNTLIRAQETMAKEIRLDHEATKLRSVISGQEDIDNVLADPQVRRYLQRRISELEQRAQSLYIEGTAEGGQDEPAG